MQHPSSDRALAALILLSLVTFWGGLLVAAGFYPGGFDWRLMPISNLSSPKHDPSGHLWASLGLALSGFSGLAWSTRLDGPALGKRAIGFGAACLILAAIPADRLHRLPHGHEIVVTMAFAGWCLGIVVATQDTLARLLATRRAVRGGAGHVARRAPILVWVPILLVALTQAWAYLDELFTPGGAVSRPIPTHFSFWEWITCLLLSIETAGLPFLIHVSRLRPQAGSRH